MSNSVRSDASEDSRLSGILAQAERVRENCDYSSQRHFNTGSLFRRVYYLMGGGVAALAAFGSATFITSDAVPSALSSITALAAALLASVTTFLKPGETANDHYRAGNAYLRLRDDAQAFLDVDIRKPESTIDTLERSVSQLAERRAGLNDSYGMLFTPDWAYRKARRDIRRGQTRYEVDRRKD